MKRVLFSMILAIASVIGALHAYGAYTNDSPTLSDLAKANIEALASIPELSLCHENYVSDAASWTIWCESCEIERGRAIDDPDGYCVVK